MNIDKQKLKAAIREINANRKAGNTVMVPEWKDAMTDAERQAWNDAWAAYQNWELQNGALRATILYSIMAHSRGRLHVKKCWEPTYGTDGGLKLVEKTFEDQLQLISGVLPEFTIAGQLEAIGA